LSCLAGQQLNDRTHAPALDVVSEGGDVNIHVPGGKGSPPVLLLKSLLIVHVSLNIVCEWILPVLIVGAQDTTLWVHHSWKSWKEIK
jgi:hypothetical protein